MRAGGYYGLLFIISKAMGGFRMPSPCCGAVTFSANQSQGLGLAVGIEYIYVGVKNFAGAMAKLSGDHSSNS